MKGIRNSMRPFLRTSLKKNFYTPGPALRTTLNIGSSNAENSKFEISGKNMPNFGNLDDNDDDDAGIDEWKIETGKVPRDEEERSEDENSFSKKSPGKRIAVVAARSDCKYFICCNNLFCFNYVCWRISEYNN